jgi:hypothetical protein
MSRGGLRLEKKWYAEIIHRRWFAASNKGFKRPRLPGFRLDTARPMHGWHNHTVAAGRCMHGKHHRE